MIEHYLRTLERYFEKQNGESKEFVMRWIKEVRGEGNEKCRATGCNNHALNNDTLCLYHREAVCKSFSK